MLKSHFHEKRFKRHQPKKYDDRKNLLAHGLTSFRIQKIILNKKLDDSSCFWFDKHFPCQCNKNEKKRTESATNACLRCAADDYVFLNFRSGKNILFFVAHPIVSDIQCWLLLVNSFASFFSLSLILFSKLTKIRRFYSSLLKVVQESFGF